MMRYLFSRLGLSDMFLLSLANFEIWILSNLLHYVPLCLCCYNYFICSPILIVVCFITHYHTLPYIKAKESKNWATTSSPGEDSLWAVKTSQSPFDDNFVWLMIIIVYNNRLRNQYTLYNWRGACKNALSDVWLTARFSFQIALYLRVKQTENLTLHQVPLWALFHAPLQLLVSII